MYHNNNLLKANFLVNIFKNVNYPFVIPWFQHSWEPWKESITDIATLISSQSARLVDSPPPNPASRPQSAAWESIVCRKRQIQEKSPVHHKIMEPKYKLQVNSRCKQRSNSYTCCRQGDCVHPNRFLYYKGAKCTINPCAMFAFQFMCQIFSNNSISPSCWFLSFNLVQLSKKSGKN